MKSKQQTFSDQQSIAPPNMAVNIWLSKPSKELGQLVRIFSLTRCHTIFPNFKLSHEVCGKEMRHRNSFVVGSRIGFFDRSMSHFVAGSRTVIPPKLTHRSTLDPEGENSGRPSRACHLGILNNAFGKGHSRQHYPIIRGIRTVPSRFFHGSAGVWAGHNKWSKVKHVKGPKDAQKSLLFNKLILQMRVAKREGGPNPELNSELASLVSKAKSYAMPKATIESILKSTAKKDADTQLLLEARGPGQSCLLIDVLTDNARRTRTEIQRILQKNGGDFGTTLYAFSRKGVVRVMPEKEGEDQPLTLDQATEVAIEVGAEDVKEMSSEDDAPLYMFICDIGELRTVRNNLASLNYAVESSSFEYLPETTVALNDINLEDTFQLISLLNDNPSVVKIYDNVESSD